MARIKQSCHVNKKTGKNMLKDKTHLLIMLTIEKIEENKTRKNKLRKLLQDEKED